MILMMDTVVLERRGTDIWNIGKYDSNDRCNCLGEMENTDFKYIQRQTIWEGEWTLILGKYAALMMEIMYLWDGKVLVFKWYDANDKLPKRLGKQKFEYS